jgi:hypothetical protein
MKTPRDILLARHQATAPKLDAIRHAAVVTVCDRRKSHASTTSIWQTLWRELILPSRRTWAGLAAVWLILAVFNFSQRDSSQVVMTKSSSPAAMTMTFRDQQRILNELFADRSSLPAEAVRPRIFSPKPRTEISEFYTV